MNVTPKAARIFRAGLPADAKSIRSLLLKSNLSAPAFSELERTTSSLIGEIRTFVCEQEGSIVGVLQWRNLGEEAEILDLAVQPELRRHGYASFLLKNFIHHARYPARQRILLEVRESNTAAIALYEKFGFQISGRRQSYYRNPEETALLMNLTFPA